MGLVPTLVQGVPEGFLFVELDKTVVTLRGFDASQEIHSHRVVVCPIWVWYLSRRDL